MQRMETYGFILNNQTRDNTSLDFWPNGAFGDYPTLAPRLNHQAARNIHYMVYELGGYSPKEWQSDT